MITLPFLVHRVTRPPHHPSITTPTSHHIKMRLPTSATPTTPRLRLPHSTTPIASPPAQDGKPQPCLPRSTTPITPGAVVPDTQNSVYSPPADLDHYFRQLPPCIRPHVRGIADPDVDAYGHCGFAAVGLAVGLPGPDDWRVVRRRMLDEVSGNPDWKAYLDGQDWQRGVHASADQVIESIDCFSPQVFTWNGTFHIRSMGPIVAHIWGPTVIIDCQNPDNSWTFTGLPGKSAHDETDPSKMVVLALVPEHLIQVSLAPGNYPLPPFWDQPSQHMISAWAQKGEWHNEDEE